MLTRISNRPILGDEYHTGRALKRRKSRLSVPSCETGPTPWPTPFLVQLFASPSPKRHNISEVIMADDDALKRLEARLTRLEATLAQQPGGTGGGTTTVPGGVVVDPAPWPGGGYGGWGRWPHPIVDPAPWWTGG